MLKVVIDFFNTDIPQYITEHRIEIMGSLLLILFESFRREIEREQKAVRAYFYRLCEHFAHIKEKVPSTDELSEMKKRFAKQFNVVPECFPSKTRARNGFLLFLETTTKFPWETKLEVYADFLKYQSKFEENDQPVESKLLHPMNRNSIKNVFAIFCGFYALGMIIETLPTLFTLETFNNFPMNLIGASIVIIIVAALTTFLYFLFVLAYKYIRKMYWKYLRN